MKTIKEIVLEDFESKKLGGYDGYLNDVINNGCVSGMVSDLIYYGDTCKFFEDHKEEINQLLSGVGKQGIWFFFGDKFDLEDQLCLEQNNQNLLAWFGYEETARLILDEIETNA